MVVVILGERERYDVNDLVLCLQQPEKAREFQKNIYFCFIDYAKAFNCVDHNKLKNSETNITLIQKTD